MTDIFMTSHKPSKYTQFCMRSILETAVQPYSLTIISTNSSAAINKNIAINMCRSDTMILIDDDFMFSTMAWNKILIDTLDRFSDASIVGCRIVELNGLEGRARSSLPDNSVIDGVRILGGIMAIRKNSIRYDELYIESQCDDVDLLLQNVDAGYSVLCNTAVRAVHLKQSTANITEDHPNLVRAYEKWGKDRYLNWGRDKSKHLIVGD